jgi:ribulose-phosphate 3-epimerase
MTESTMRLSASVVCMDWLRIEDDLRGLEELAVDALHFDIMDGYFVADFSMGAAIVAAIRARTSLPAEFHTMVEEPRRIFGRFPARDAEHFGIHYEASRNLHRDIVTLRKLGFRPGLVLSPPTPLESAEYILDELERITIMTTQPGFDDQRMAPGTLDRIQALCAWRDRACVTLEIAVDGGIPLEAVSEIAAAGADRLVVGGGALLADAGSLRKAVTRVREAVAGPSAVGGG